MAMTSYFSDMTSWSNFFDVVWFSCQASLVTGPSFMSLSSLVLVLWQFWNSKIGNTPVWVFPNIWTLGQIRNTKFGINVSNKMLLNAAFARVTPCTVSELLRKNQQGGVKLLPSLTQIRVNDVLLAIKKKMNFRTKI